MPFAAITYQVKPGFDDDIAWIFHPDNFIRVDSPVLHDDDGEEIGFLISTGLFLQHDTIIRVIQHDGGQISDIRRHMSVQEGVHEAERRLMPFLSEPRDTETPEGFLAHFDRSLMTMIDVEQADNRPAAALAAFCYRLREGVTVSDVVDAYAEVGPADRIWPTGPGGIIATLLCGLGNVVVRVIHHECEDAEAALCLLAEQPGATERWLAGLLDEDAAPIMAYDWLAAHRMRKVSLLSAAVTG